MALDYHPIQNSEVYLLGSTHTSSIPPPSPPSPATPCERALSPPLDDLISITPPEISKPCSIFAHNLQNAVHVLSTEATALSYLTRLYETDPIARSGFHSAVEAITRFRGEKGKLVICGIGKSGHIAKKLVATMNSLKIHSTYLHPTEALHGDLGKVGRYDTILLITFSGKTPELMSLLPHFDASLPMIVMTSHTHPSTCEIIRHRPSCILLPAPIHQSETDSFGFNAPTTSTTMALALGDALAVVISNELHINVQAVFSSNHPGGAIGAACKVALPEKLEDSCVALENIPDINQRDVTGAQILMLAYQTKSDWVRIGDNIVIPPGRIRRLRTEHFNEPAHRIDGLLVKKEDWIEVDGDMDIEMTQEWLRETKRRPMTDDLVLMVKSSRKGETLRLLEAAELNG